MALSRCRCALAGWLGATMGLAAAGGALAGADPCAADLNLDTAVDSADLNLLLGAFGSGAGGDVDGDGDTDSPDLNALLGAFGTTGCPGDCCASNGTPTCADPGCTEIVCAQDGFCCDEEWDSLCAGQAAELCGVCGGCCEANGSPGCGDDGCEALICGVDPFCCDTEWDGLCAETAGLLCGLCGGEAGACCFGATCSNAFLEADCVNDGGVFQGVGTTCGGVSCVVCCETNGTPGCGDADCEALVCELDSFCCTDEWDEICVGNALELCGVCGGDGPVPGACCFDNGACVITTTEFECGFLGGAYIGDFVECDEVNCSDPFDCCTEHATPGCDDDDCESLVCAADPFCCDTEWDDLCADGAAEICGECGGCCEANGTPGCGDPSCEALVCANDPFCCETEWDGLCADQAVDECPACAGGAVPPPPPPPATGACCSGTGACSTLTEGECALSEGVYQGDGTSCSAGVCDPPPPPGTGACCIAINGECFIGTPSECDAAGGIFEGVGSTCAGSACSDL